MDAQPDLRPAPTVRVDRSTDQAEMSARNITVRFQGVAAISDVSLTLQRHRVLGLIGPNGAGKTTLVNVLTGFQRPTSGRVLLGPTPTDGWSATTFRKRGIARTFQGGRLFKELSVIENVEVAGVGLGLSRRAAFDHGMALLDWFGIADKAHASAGVLAYTDERRLGIVRALVNEPAFVLLDEPAAGMSDSECEELSALVSLIPDVFACGVLLIEHNMHVVMQVCHAIHVLDGGRTIAEGTPAHIQGHEAVRAAYLGGH